MIRNVSSFTHRFRSSIPYNETETFANPGRRLVISSAVATFEPENWQSKLQGSSYSDIPRINLLDSDDSVIFGLVPYHNNLLIGVDGAAACPRNYFFQIPGRGLFLENGLKANAICPELTQGAQGRITLSIFYQG